MPIQTTKPTIVEATPEKTYDKVWMKRLTIEAPDPNGDAKANVVLVNYTEDQEGVREEAPGERIRMQVPTLLSGAEFDETQVTELLTLLAEANEAQKLGLMQTAILHIVESIASDRGLI